MRLSISTLTCPDWPLERIVAACAQNGIGGIDPRGLGEEIDVTRHVAFNAGLEQTLALLRTHGLELPCFNTSVTLVSPGPQRWQDMLDEARRYAVLAARTRTPYIRVFGGAAPQDMSADEARAMARRHLRQVIKICKPQGAIPLVETHDAWSTSARVRELLHEFDPAEVGALWDVEHPYRNGEAPGDTAESLRRYIRHVHFKDSTRTDGKSTPRLLGEGELPLADFVRAWRAIGYHGCICLETEKRWHAQTAPEPEISIPQFANFMRSIAPSD
jgi:sugar phosphate isomerase/epimerase